MKHNGKNLKYVRKNRGRDGGLYYYFVYKGIRVRLPEPGDPSFRAAYSELLETRAARVSPDFQADMKSNDEKNYFTEMERGARSRAKRAGREFSLPRGWMEKQYDEQNGRCAVSDIAMCRRDGLAKDPWAPSIDRINSDLGYTVENCQLVCFIVNNAKGKHEQKDFNQMCHAVAKMLRTEHIQNKNVQNTCENINSDGKSLPLRTPDNGNNNKAVERCWSGRTGRSRKPMDFE